jgi:nitrile hydratase
MSARFSPGDAVRVAERESAGHVRTPRYIRGKRGTVERVCGRFGNPEELAYGRAGAAVTLYRVRFAQSDVWPHYRGAARDTIDVELYEHWLEKA